MQDNLMEKEIKSQNMTGYPSIDEPWLKYYSQDAIDTPLPECTMYEYIKKQNEGYCDNTAIIYFETEITYRELFENIDKAANAFLETGVKVGEVVSIIAITTPELIYAIYGLNKIGAVCNMLDPRMPEDTINLAIEQSESKCILMLDIFANQIKLNIAESQNLIILNMAESMPLHLKRDCDFLKTEFPCYVGWCDFINRCQGNVISNSFN